MDLEAIRDLFAPLGPVRARRMFGGYGLYAEDRIFAIAIRGDVYLKAAGELAERFRAAGSHPFSFVRQGRVVTMGYWRLPDAALDDPEEAARWARLSLENGGSPPSGARQR